MLKRWQSLFLGLSGSLLVVSAQTPGFAAQRVALRYGLFERSVAVSDLREYAETQKASPELKKLLRPIKPAEREIVQQALQTKVPVSVVTVDRLLRTPPGKKILADVAEVTVRRDDAGVQAARAGLVVGSVLPGGLGVLNFLEAYPSHTITLSLPRALKFARENQRLLRGAAGGLLDQAPGN